MAGAKADCRFTRTWPGSFPKLASSIWWPVVSKFSDWKDERPPIDNITDLQAMSVVDFKEVSSVCMLGLFACSCVYFS